ncbi:MAG TPA: alpha/beta fold hydrolase [Anaerolineales bacterium]|nr:alpha/beta fold hydrolase [Anaerolineales bacterium]
MKKISGQHRTESIILIAGRAALLLIVLTVLAGFAGVNDALHPPRIIPPGNTLRKYKVPYQSVDLTTQDGIRLSAWYTPPKNGAVILLAHGYGDNRPEWVYQMLVKRDYGVLAWDARAHGQSDGKISTFGYLEVLDVKAGLDYALAQPGVQHIGAWGGSMGGATLIRATAQFPQIEALFVDSSFDSLEDEFNFLVPYPLINPLAKVITRLETGIDLEAVSPIDEIGRISPRPVYIVHSTADIVAPPEAGERLFNAAQEPRFLWLEESAPHLAIYLDNPRRYQHRLVDFFDEWLLGIRDSST